MSSVLENLDNISKNVVSLIVLKYNTDNHELHYLPNKQADGVGISFIELMEKICNCKILKSCRNFVFKFNYKDDAKFNYIQQQVAHHGNNGFLNHVRALQVISFLIRLNNDGLIIFPEFSYEKAYPLFKGAANSDKGDMFFPIKNDEINDFISKAYFSHICPTVTLINFAKKFKTTEKRRFQLSQQLGWAGIFTAILIALGSPFLMTKCASTKIDNEQFNAIIKTIESDSIFNVNFKTNELYE